MKVIHQQKIKYIPASHEKIDDVGVWKKILLKRDDIGQGRIQMVNWAKLPVGKTFRNHYHEDMSELFIVVSGEVEAKVDDNIIQLVRGDCLVVEIGEQHTMKNSGSTDVEYVVIGITNAGQGRTVTIDSL